MMPGSRAHEQDGFKRRRYRWSREEDQKLIEYKNSTKSRRWANVPKDAGLMSRSGKSCRLRWTNYLKPGIKDGNFTQEENNTIIRLQSHYGNQWSRIARKLEGRTEIEIKNHWNTRLKKNLARKKDIPTATQTTLSQKSLAAADLFDSTGNYRNGNALKLADAQLPNLHLLHNLVLQGFGYVTPNPQAQLHGLTRFNSIGPVQALPTTLPPQGSSFHYQAMEGPVPQPRNNHGADFINMPTDPAQTLPSLPPQGLLSFTYQAMEEPPVNNNYTDRFGPSITHVGYGNVPNGSSIPPLMVSAISMTNQVENEITLPADSNPFSTSTIGEAWPQWVMPGHNMPTDPAQTLPSLPPQGLLSFTYPAMEEPPVNNNDTDQFGPSITHVGYGNVPNGSSIPPLMVSAISMTNQVENEITLPAEEISNPFSNSTTCEAWPQFVTPGQNTSTISEAWPQSVGHNMPTDPQTLPSLPPHGLLSFTYQAMEEPTVNSNYTDQFGPWITNITNSPVCGDLSLEYFSLVHPNTTLM